MRRSAFVLLVISVLLAACSVPYDVENTKQNVKKSGAIDVGIVSGAAPWAMFHHGKASGVEVELIRRFAKELGVKVHWVPGSESQLMPALKHYRLDIVIGNLHRSDPWKKQLALTNVYYKSRVMFGVPKSMNAPDDLSGHTVAVAANSGTAAKVRNAGGKPVALRRRRSGEMLVAAPEWQLRQWGLKAVKPILATHKHVMAVPRGENGWLVALERSLHKNKSAIPRLLKREVQQTRRDGGAQSGSASNGGR